MELTTRAQRMVDSAPDYYATSDLYKSMQQAIADELDRVEANNADLEKQRSIMTATWGLRYFEQELGIPVNESDPYDIRRSRVLAKWRGVGKFSAALIKSVAQAFSNGEVDVTVFPSTYTVVVTFTGTRGVPPNLDDCKAAIENIVHAHLGVEYKFIYTIHQELRSFTHAQMRTMTNEQLKTQLPTV